MEIKFYSSDSLGVRSMAHSIITNDGIILVDPGAALGPSRYGLPPHPLELDELEKTIEKIEAAITDADIIIITHYHYDHYLYKDEHLECYRGKKLIVKHSRNQINWSQKKRSFSFLRKLSNLDTKIIQTNGGCYFLGKTKIEISPPVWHGQPGTKLGKVLMIYIEDEENKYLYASDTQGPIDPEALKWISMKRPEILYMSGPPFYLKGTKLGDSLINEAEKNLIDLIKNKVARKIIIDHHFSRLLGYEKKLFNYNQLNKQVNVSDVASYIGVERRPLEAMRKQLWEKK